MLIKLEKQVDLEKVKGLFNDIRFFMGKSVLDGVMGECYVDNTDNPLFAILLVRTYCFMSGTIDKENLRNLINENLKNYKIIPSDNLKIAIEILFKNSINKTERYSTKKNPKFNIKNLQENIKGLPENYHVQKIDMNIAQKIIKENFINITDDYQRNGIGICCIYNNEVIGVASSNIFYKNGIEVNIKVKDNHRNKGIATIMASELILLCIKLKQEISWDAANLASIGLAKKLGFEYDSTYDVYKF